MYYKISYKNMKVWQKSMELVYEVYQEIKKFPAEERFGLADQMRRAVVSIPSNIAEGSARNSDKDFRHFLFIANGSVAELETQILICSHLGYMKQEKTASCLDKIDHIKRMITNFTDYLGRSSRGS